MERNLLLKELTGVLDNPKPHTEDICGHHETPQQEYRSYLQAVAGEPLFEFETNDIPTAVGGLSFAPEPPMGSYWPLITKREPILSFKTTDNKFVGNTSRAFRANRSDGERYHVGMDLYANYKDPIVACEKGKVINFYHFYHGTYCLIVEHDKVVVNYGEVDGKLPKNVFVGANVEAGQIIARVGRMSGGSSMLHFETYRKGVTKNIPWKRNEVPSQNILNPTKYLSFLKNFGLKQTIDAIPTYQLPATDISPINKKIIANRRLAISLGWDKYIYEINNLLLPYSGLSNVSLSEDAFAEALAKWQREKGLGSDGVLGPKTWKRMQVSLQIKSVGKPQKMVDELSIAIEKPNLNAFKTIYFKTNHGIPDVNNLTGIYLPTDFSAEKELNIILYFHGMTRSTTIKSYWQQKEYQIRETLQTTKKKAILIAPTLGHNPNKTGKLSNPAFFDKYLTNIIESLMKQGLVATNATVKNIFLSAHSAGGKLMLNIATSNSNVSNKIRECWGLDCFYWGAERWVDWAKNNPDKKLWVYYTGSIIGHKSAKYGNDILYPKKGAKFANIAGQHKTKPWSHSSIVLPVLKERIGLSQFISAI